MDKNVAGRRIIVRTDGEFVPYHYSERTTPLLEFPMVDQLNSTLKEIFKIDFEQHQDLYTGYCVDLERSDSKVFIKIRNGLEINRDQDDQVSYDTSDYCYDIDFYIFGKSPEVLEQILNSKQKDLYFDENESQISTFKTIEQFNYALTWKNVFTLSGGEYICSNTYQSFDDFVEETVGEYGDLPKDVEENADQRLNQTNINDFYIICYLVQDDPLISTSFKRTVHPCVKLDACKHNEFYDLILKRIVNVNEMVWDKNAQTKQIYVSMNNLFKKKDSPDENNKCRLLRCDLTSGKTSNSSFTKIGSNQLYFYSIKRSSFHRENGLASFFLKITEEEFDNLLSQGNSGMWMYYPTAADFEIDSQMTLTAIRYTLTVYPIPITTVLEANEEESEEDNG